MSLLPDRSIILIEDIDTAEVTHQRNDKEMVAPEVTPSGKQIVRNKGDKSDSRNMFNLADLSDILNAVDGMFSAHGRILIATTNRPDILDPALIRPGRIDLNIEIGYVTIEILQCFIASFYPDHEMPQMDKLKMKPAVTVAMLQGYVVAGKSLEELLSAVCEKVC
jgi:chaperone BCS1